MKLFSRETNNEWLTLRELRSETNGYLHSVCAAAIRLLGFEDLWKAAFNGEVKGAT